MEGQDGRYWNKPWQLFSETIAGDRTWEQQGPSWTPPVMPVLDPEQMIPPRFGYRTTELTIFDVLDNTFSRLSSKTDDWSGVEGGYSGSMRPTGAGGGGIV